MYWFPTLYNEEVSSLKWMFILLSLTHEAKTGMMGCLGGAASLHPQEQGQWSAGHSLGDALSRAAGVEDKEELDGQEKRSVF